MSNPPLRVAVASIGLALACRAEPDAAARPWPLAPRHVPVSTQRRLEVHDAESLGDGAMILAGALGAEGFVARIDGNGLASIRTLGRFVTDLAVAPDGDVLAIGWDDDAAFWRLGQEGEIREHASLHQGGVGVDPYRVLPGPVVIGTHNPITSGQLDGWIVHRDGDAWRQALHHGGGYSGFLDAALTDDGFVAVGMGSEVAEYQGWIGVQRGSEWRERHVGGAHQILHAVAPLPDGGFVVAGIGRAAKLDDALAIVAEVSWPAPGVFAYAPMIVDGDVAWLLARHGPLRNQYTRVEVLRLGLAEPMVAPEVFRVHLGATGGALVRRPDGVLWSVISSPLGGITLEPLVP